MAAMTTVDAQRLRDLYVSFDAGDVDAVLAATADHVD
jgi:hypothetical protein